MMLVRSLQDERENTENVVKRKSEELDKHKVELDQAKESLVRKQL